MVMVRIVRIWVGVKVSLKVLIGSGLGLGIGLVLIINNMVTLRMGWKIAPVMYICASRTENNTEPQYVSAPPGSPYYPPYVSPPTRLNIFSKIQRNVFCVVGHYVCI